MHVSNHKGKPKRLRIVPTKVTCLKDNHIGTIGSLLRGGSHTPPGDLTGESKIQNLYRVLFRRFTESRRSKITGVHKKRTMIQPQPPRGVVRYPQHLSSWLLLLQYNRVIRSVWRPDCCQNTFNPDNMDAGPRGSGTWDAVVGTMAERERGWHNREWQRERREER